MNAQHRTPPRRRRISLIEAVSYSIALVLLAVVASGAFDVVIPWR